MRRHPTFWTDVEAIFSSTVTLAPAERATLLHERCAGHAELHAEVESLLEAHDTADSFLTPSAHDLGVRFGDYSLARVNDVLGGWRLLERIGRGGMSDIYRAERADAAFAHQVAVKIIHTLARGRNATRRFVAERQILGALHHPHIVALIDGGTTGHGNPYLVMELVEGVPLTQHARDHHVPLDERLRLFVQVCTAVQYAHQNGVVHRDLKPANILVTPDGVTKVLDFGVAKLLTAIPGIDGATVTGALMGPLTPNYASPEQLRGLPVTTASDIYALGVLLYELLSGERPYETANQPLDVVLTQAATAPRRPSAVVDRAGAVRPLPYSRARLRGDLDAIVLRAMSVEPERRYASASELASDLMRVLAGRPVLAREPSAGYLFRRFAARHKGLVATAAAAILAILATSGAAIWQARVAERERTRAERRSAEVRQLANALIFKIHEAVVGVPGNTQVRQLIVNEARGYLERLAHDAQGDATAALDLARAYKQLGAVQGSPMTSNLGDRDGAIVSYRRGIALLEPFAGQASASPDLLEELAGLHQHACHTLSALRDRRAEAQEAGRKGLAVASRLLAARPEHLAAMRTVADAHFQLGLALSSHATEQHMRAAVDLHRRRYARLADGEVRLQLAVVEWALAGYLEAHLRAADARPHHERTRQLFEEHLQSTQPSRLGAESRGSALNAIGFAHYYLGDLERASAAYRDSIALRTGIAVQDGDNALMWPSVAITRASLARVYEAMGRHADALREVEAGLMLLQNRTFPASFAGGVAEAHLRSGRLRLRGGDRARGCASLRRATTLYEELTRDERLQPIDRERQQESQRLMAGCGSTSSSN